MPILTPLADRYKPDRLLKEGRYNTISRVQDIAEKTTRVARLIRQPRGATEVELLQGLQILARNASTLRHPSVPRFDKIVEGAGGTWLLFHWFEGRPLGNYLGAEASINDEWIIWWLARVLDALIILHTNSPSFVVGYLEPSDVIISGSNVFLCDIGIFEDLFPHLAPSTLQNNQFVNFIAPERRHASSTAPVTDVFSAAAIAFWLMTGHAPCISAPNLEGPHREALLRYRPDMPNAVRDLVLQGLAFHPGKRPQSAANMRSLLEPHIVDMTGYQPPPFPTQEDVQYRAQTTKRVVFAHAPEPISIGPAVVEESDGLVMVPHQPRPLPVAAIAKAGLGLAAVMLVVAIGMGVKQRLAPVEPGWLVVASGQVAEEDGYHRPAARIRPGQAVNIGEGGSTLRFGIGSTLQVSAAAELKNAGMDHDDLSLTVNHGRIHIQTGTTDRVALRLPASILEVMPATDLEIDLDNPNLPYMPIALRKGKATVSVQGVAVPLEVGVESRLSSDGSSLSTH